jgi:hypothetical protein
MEHNKIVGQKPARDTEMYKNQDYNSNDTTTSFFSLQILKTQYKDTIQNPPAKGYY